jgi:hypothetical protein
VLGLTRLPSVPFLGAFSVGIPRQHPIEHDNVIRMRLCEGQALLSIGRRIDSEPIFAQALNQR